MKSVLCAIVLLSALHYAQAQSPCDDPLYLKLKAKSLDSMSQREFDYFMLKEKYCNEQAAAQKPAPIVQQSEILIDFSMLKKYAGFKPKCGAYVDGICYGNFPAEIKVNEGPHTVSLFSDESFQGAGRGDRERMQGATVKVMCNPGKKAKVTFTFKCDTGINFVCNDNEWYFTNETTESDEE